MPSSDESDETTCRRSVGSGNTSNGKSMTLYLPEQAGCLLEATQGLRQQLEATPVVSSSF